MNQTNRGNFSTALKELSKVRSDRGPVFSLYLNRSGSSNIGESLQSRFMKLLQPAGEQAKLDQKPASYQDQWVADVARIRGWLMSKRLPGEKSLAIFSSLSAGLWQVFPLPATIPDRLTIGDQPFLRPLEILSGEHPCTLVVLIDEGSARLAKVFLGSGEEIEYLQAVPVTGDSPVDILRQHAFAVVDHAVEAWQDQSCDRLVVGGSSAALEALHESLPETLLQRLAGEFELSQGAALDDIVAKVQQIEEEQERRLETRRVEQIIAAADSSGEALFGPEQTLLAVQSKKARLLIVEDGFHLEGGVCPNCGYLGEWEQGACLLCEMALRPEPDIIEAALKRVLDQGGEIEILRTPEQRHALSSYGRIGALLQSAELSSPGKARRSEQAARPEGKGNPDARQDEAVDESFPASDPPGW